MKLLTTILLAAVIVPLSALELSQMRLDRLNPQQEYELHYRMSETVAKDGKSAVEKTAAEIYILVKKANAKTREYQITVRDQTDARQQAKISFSSADGGKTVQKMSMINADGSQTALTEKEQLDSYSFLPKTGITVSDKEFKKAGYQLNQREIPVRVYSGTTKNSHLDAAGGLELKIDSDLEEKLYLSDDQKLPVLVKSEFIVNNHRYAGHAENKELQFGRLNQKAKIVKTIELVDVKESALQQQNNKTE